MPKKNRMFSVLQSVAQQESTADELTNNNTLTISSKSTGSLFLETGKLKNVTLRDGKRLVENIVDRIFDANIGLANISSSQPSLSDGFEQSEEMDVRLKRWQDTLRDRRQMQEKISRKTGKNPNEMLFNLPASVDQRDKGTVQRLMDFASRMNPITLKQKEPDVLPARYDERTGRCLPAIQETLPQAERTGEFALEIVGLPLSTKKEILCPYRAFTEPHPNQKNKWINSKELEKQLLEKDVDIKRVLDFCPDFSCLEVVGNSQVNVHHHEDINLVARQDICTVSSSTESTSLVSQLTCEADLQQQSMLDQSIVNVGIKINDMVFNMDQKRTLPSEMQFEFECEPYQLQVKNILRLENIGRKVLVCDWTKSYDPCKRSQDWADCDKSFLFDNKLLFLFPGDVYISKALYRPCVVSLSKQRWELRIFPNVFCIHRGSLVVQLFGKCGPSPIYSEKINKHIQCVIDKSNDQAIRKLSTNQGKLAPLIESPEMLCPYKRNLDERDLFNALNVGYHCERFEDLGDLKALYIALKKPREPKWDLSLDSLKKLIMRLPVPEYRESNFNKLIQIQESMKSPGDSKFFNFDHRKEQERSRLIYVRGCISTGIEEWEELMLSIEETCLKSEIVNFYLTEDEKSSLRQFELEKLERHLLKKLRAKKYYRDSLYMQTYTLMCDIAENMVSVIESTDFI